MLKVTLQWCSIYSGDQPHFCELKVCSDLSLNNNRIEYFQLHVQDSFSSLFPCRRYVQNIVATDETISILGLELSINVLLGLLHSNVHVPIQTGKDSCTLHMPVEYHRMRNAEIVNTLGERKNQHNRNFFEIFIAKFLLSFISLTIQRPILPILTFVIRA